MFYALGSAGQSISINPEEQLVIVTWATWGRPPAPGGANATNERNTFEAAVIHALH